MKVSGVLYMERHMLGGDIKLLPELSEFHRLFIEF